MNRYLVDEIAFGTRTGKHREIAAETAKDAAEILLGRKLEASTRMRSAVARVQVLDVKTSPAVSYFEVLRRG